MLRKIIHIDEEKCNGCGACAAACHEGAIGMVDGKAKLLRDDYCDGLGDCLPACPTNAISFEEREAAAYDEAAVMAAKAQKKQALNIPLSCASSAPSGMKPKKPADDSVGEISSQLRQWPVQIKLAPINAAFFNNADILIAADCTAYAYGDFHRKFMQDRITLIGCTKLDDGDYSEKLSEIFRTNSINSILVTRMEVPCCGGMESVVRRAIEASGKDIPLEIVTLSYEGKILGTKVF